MKFFTYSLLLAVLPLSCTSPSDKAKEAVNPFFETATTDTLDAATLSELKSARGKSVKYIQYQALTDMFERDINTVQMFLFWDTPDEASIQILKSANNYPEMLPSANLPVNLIAVYTGLTENHSKLTQYLREYNLAYDVLILNEKDWAKLYQDFGSQWRGGLPAILVVNKEQQLFHFFDHMPTLGEIELVWQQAQ